MRFLNTSTLQFEQIPDSELHLKENQYAILSHRWGADKDEISFEDVRLSTDFSNKKGFNKIKGFCEAVSANCRFGWVDTCCIHKDNLSELSEAINSMYRWYQGSKICIVYLEDVPQKQLTDSEWFNRGWTLQELIGPKNVTFFDHDWNIIGTKTELITDLSRKTRIPEGILSHNMKLSACSVAQRMSWGANRETTRVEDRAYSLMGIFDINMPMIYGEREKAFLRLQQQIIQKSKDESIFAWDMDFEGYTRTYSGLYAPSPLAYAKCSEIIQTQGSHGFSENNGELSMRLRTVPHSPEIYLARLHCSDRAHPNSAITILISRTSVEGEYVRVADAKNVIQRSSRFDLWRSFQERQIRVSVNPTEPPSNIFNGFFLQTPQLPDHYDLRTTILSNSQTSQVDYVCPPEYNQGIAGVVLLESKDHFGNLGGSENRWITISFDKDFNPVLWLTYLYETLDHPDRPNLRSSFQQAVRNGIESSEHQQIMRAFTFSTKGSMRKRRLTSVDGIYAFQDTTIIVRKTGIREQVIRDLNLKVSVELRPCHSSITTSAEDIDGSEMSPNSVNIWVVSITDLREGKEHNQGKQHWYSSRFFATLRARWLQRALN